MRCGDFIYHPVFDREKLRIDLKYTLPWLSWNEGILKRSIDLYPFTDPDICGSTWPRINATYPCNASPVLIKAGQNSLRRYHIFNGNLEQSLGWGLKSLRLSLRQKQESKYLHTFKKYIYKIQSLSKPETSTFMLIFHPKTKKQRCKIIAPVGARNLGNTYYANAILQCLIHIGPLQHFF